MTLIRHQRASKCSFFGLVLYSAFVYGVSIVLTSPGRIRRVLRAWRGYTWRWLLTTFLTPGVRYPRGGLAPNVALISATTHYDKAHSTRTARKAGTSQTQQVLEAGMQTPKTRPYNGHSRGKAIAQDFMTLKHVLLPVRRDNVKAPLAYIQCSHSAKMTIFDSDVAK